MRTQLRWWFWSESILGGMSLGIALLTAVWRDWAESIFDTAPDRSSGMVEWAVVVGMAMVAGLLAMLARAEWRRATTAAL